MFLSTWGERKKLITVHVFTCVSPMIHYRMDLLNTDERTSKTTFMWEQFNCDTDVQEIMEVCWRTDWVKNISNVCKPGQTMRYY